MKKLAATVAACMMCLLALASAGYALTPEESLKKSFPDIPVDSIAPSNISGLYEVTAGQQIFYYAPEAECIVGGPVVAKGGRNLTQEKAQVLEQKRLARIGEKVKDLPLDRALKIGSGKNRVIEITDPDCGYCRRAAEFFKGRKDVTKYIFFLPLPMHKDAEQKARYILCAQDKAKAYADTMSGKMDDMKFKVCKDDAVSDQIRIHKEAARQLGVTGTPFFVINGQSVSGANIPLIEQLLGK